MSRLVSRSLILRTITPVLILVLGYVQPAQAITINNDSNNYRTRNNIVFYDPNDNGGLGSCGDDSGNFSGDTNAEKVYNYLTSTAIKTNDNKPMTAAQAAGVIGNLMVESGGNTYDIKPDAINPSSGARGIVQWLGGRWSSPNGNGLKQFAEDKKKSWSDLLTQAEFIVFELEKTEPGVIKDSAFKNAANTADGAATAAARWAQLYERPGPPPYQKREENARKAFADFGSGATTDEPTAPAPTASLQQTTSSACSGGSSNGYVFPLQATKSQIRKWGNDPGTTEWKSGRYHENVYPGYYAVDIMAPEGTPVVAFHSGTVLSIRNGDSFGALSIQIIDDEGYTYYNQHLSLSRGAKVKVGQKVEAGTLIGYVGNKREGWNSVPHLHIDKSKNPGAGHRGPCTASRRSCPIADDDRFVEITKQLNDTFEKLPDTVASSL